MLCDRPTQTHVSKGKSGSAVRFILVGIVLYILWLQVQAAAEDWVDIPSQRQVIDIFAQFTYACLAIRWRLGQ